MSMKNSKNRERKNSSSIIYKFLIFMFIANIYLSGASIGYIISTTVLLYISLDIIRDKKRKSPLS